MGVYLNPGNSGFERIKSGTYIDKTGLIGLINNLINTPKNLVCISRPRRFGKSYAAQMLCAYYDVTCDSRELFSDLKIAQDESFQKHINQYNVIYLDMTQILGEAGRENFIDFINTNVIKEINTLYPDIDTTDSLVAAMIKTVEITGHKFIMIIDEWDAPIRENPEIERQYLHFLRMLFKSSGTTARIFAAAYMTGILPIKKDGSQSAISDFYEYTMIKPRQFGEYVGFTEAEVRNLCEENDVSFELMKRWYDGYAFKGVGSVYNPNSVMKAITFDEFDSYWTETSAAEGLMSYISMDYTGLSKTIAELIGGVDVPVMTIGFANDLVTFRGQDDVLTLLIHLGYLAYDSEKGMVRIPNEEIRMEFQRAIHYVDHSATVRRLRECERLFTDTIEGNEDAVARQIEKIHMEETTPLLYNREDSLRAVIKLAYYTYRDHYLKFEKLPSGKGFADVIYLPKHDSGYPALVIELKWNHSAEGAIEQILKNNYPAVLKDFGSEILLVGINYDKDAPKGERRHSCRIIKI